MLHEKIFILQNSREIDEKNTKHVENKMQNGVQISNRIRNDITCAQTKQSRQKAEPVRLTRKKKEKQQAPIIFNYMRCKDIHIKFKDTKMLKIRGWQEIFHANSNHRKAIVI